MAVNIEQPPFTMEDVKKYKKIHRCVEFKKDEFGNIATISWREPCKLCGKYHQLFSKASKRCNLKLAMMVYSVMNEDVQYE